MAWTAIDFQRATAAAERLAVRVDEQVAVVWEAEPEPGDTHFGPWLLVRESDEPYPFAGYRDPAYVAGE